MRGVKLEDGRHVMALTPDDIKPYLSTVSTADLQTELLRREGVRTFRLRPDDRFECVGYVGGHLELNSDRPNEFTIVGPAIITVNID